MSTETYYFIPQKLIGFVPIEHENFNDTNFPRVWVKNNLLAFMHCGDLVCINLFNLREVPEMQKHVSQTFVEFSGLEFPAEYSYSLILEEYIARRPENKYAYSCAPIKSEFISPLECPNLQITEDDFLEGLAKTELHSFDCDDRDYVFQIYKYAVKMQNKKSKAKNIMRIRKL